MKKIIFFFFCLLSSVFSYSQETVEMADELRASGKIYIVVGVLVTILFGLILYLILIDRKVSGIEKRINKK